jgi:hypothetical protein
MAGEQSHVSEARRTRKDGLEKVPAIVWYTDQVDCQLTQDAALTRIAGVRHQGASKLPPSGRLSDIDEAFDATLPERQHCMWCSDLEIAEQCHGRNAREFPNEGCYATRTFARTAHGNEHGLDMLRFQVPDQIVHGLAMQRPVVSLTGSVDA